MTKYQPADLIWMEKLKLLFEGGRQITTRGMECLEMLGQRSVIDMHFPVVTSKTRKLSYKYMAAEALWILNGDMRVETIAPYCPNIKEFSDSGRVFQGAYGPKVLEQMHYVVETLTHDPGSRQAVIDIWRPMPRQSKDIPCTLSLQFFLRDKRLNTIVTMRSSDLWLGWPYDVFTFTMITSSVLLQLPNQVVSDLGFLQINHGSLHLYSTEQKPNVASASKLILDPQFQTPVKWSPLAGTPESLIQLLTTLRDNPGLMTHN